MSTDLAGQRQMKKTGRDIHRRNACQNKRKPRQPFSNDDSALCVPDPAQGLGETDVVGLKLVQTDRGGQSEGAQEPVAERAELGHTPRAEVVGDGGPGKK